jgi:hypothetical protein
MLQARSVRSSSVCGTRTCAAEGSMPQIPKQLDILRAGVQQIIMTYMCPVCAYGMTHEPANYHICPSCGTEFGLHDQNATIEELRNAWIRTGPQWWSQTDEPPSNWNPHLQLANLKLSATAGTLVVISTTSAFGDGVKSINISASGADPLGVRPTTQDYFGWADRAWGQKSEDRSRALERQ